MPPTSPVNMTRCALVVILLVASVASADVVYVGQEVITCTVEDADSAYVSLGLTDGQLRRVKRTDVEWVQVNSISLRKSLSLKLGDIQVAYVPDPTTQWGYGAAAPLHGTRVNQELVYQAGGQLSNARTAFFWALGLEFAAGVVYGIANSLEGPKDPLFTIHVPVGLLVGSFVSSVVA